MAHHQNFLEQSEECEELVEHQRRTTLAAQLQYHHSGREHHQHCARAKADHRQIHLLFNRFLQLPLVYPTVTHRHQGLGLES